MIRSVCLALAAVMVAVIASADAASSQTIAGVASVIDGDTLELHGKRIRLFGIDSLEGRQLCSLPNGRDWRCGRDAAFALADRIGRDPITCAQHDMDRYGRLVGVCSLAGTDLNEWMVAQGWAVAYRQFSRAYVAAEDEARRRGLGIWASQFEMPWEWRRRNI